MFEFAKCKALVTGLAVSSDGQRFATLSTDRKVRVFKFQTGKLVRVFDETLPTYTQMQQTSHALPNMEFGRRFLTNCNKRNFILHLNFFVRMAAERDLEKSEFNMSNNIIFDASGNFLIYPTMIGIKIINIKTNRCVNILGKTDNIRPLHIGLFQVRFSTVLHCQLVTK